jgi:hypothetical protein
MWEDMGTYWAQRKPTGTEPPTVKRLEYADLGTFRLAVTVYDDDKPRAIHREELARILEAKQ